MFQKYQFQAYQYLILNNLKKGNSLENLNKYFEHLEKEASVLKFDKELIELGENKKKLEFGWSCQLT